MSNVAITKVHKGQDVQEDASSFLEDFKALTSQIRDHAFAIFQKRGAGEGKAVDDWLEAERSLTCATESELIEKDSAFQLSVAVPGFAEKDIKVTALPDELVVSAVSEHRHEKDEGNIHFCEFAEKQLFRRFELPKAINVDKVTASVDKGILRVTAEKAQQEKLAARAA